MSRTIRYSLLILLLLAVAAPIGFAKEQSLLARVTVYWASGGSGSDAWTRKHIASSGARLRAGHCAVDPRRIPYGSRVVLPDGTLTAVDTGSAVRSRRAARLAGRSSAERSAIVIDRFFETKGQALAWAARNPHFMTVKVHSPNETLRTVTTSRVATTSTTRVAPNNLRPTFVRTVTTTSSTTQRLVSSPQPQPAVLRGTTLANVPVTKLVAANSRPTTPVEDPQQELLAKYNAAQPRSHYGRSIAYTP